MSVVIVNNPKLLDELLKFNSYAGLFINDIKQNDESPQFVEPNFDGYAPLLLDKINWGPSIKESNYATITYKNEIFWINQENINATIRGYFLKNLSNQIVWFHTFNDPVTIAKSEGIYINPKVYLNNYDNLFNTMFIFNIINPNPGVPLNPTISITNEYWGNVIAVKPLINTVTGNSNYSPVNNCLTLALDPKIDPRLDLPFSFTIKSSQPSFYSAVKNVNITSNGIYEHTLHMIEVG